MPKHKSKKAESSSSDSDDGPVDVSSVQNISFLLSLLIGYCFYIRVNYCGYCKFRNFRILMLLIQNEVQINLPHV